MMSKVRQHLARSALALLLAGSAGAIAPAFAEPVMDLSRVYALALEQDPMLRASEHRLRSNAELLPQARAALLPSISLDGDSSRVTEGSGGFSNTSNRSDWSTGINLVQPLVRLEVFALRDRAHLEIDQATLQLGLARQDVLLRAAQTYFDVLLARDRIASLDAEQRAISTELRRAQRALDVGTGTITDVNEAQARFDLVEARILQADNSLQIARETLRRLIGQTAGELAGLRPGFVAQPPLPVAPRVWAERAEAGNLNVIRAENARQVADENLRIEEAGRLPRVDLVAGIGRASRADSFGNSDERDTGRVGVRLQMPLYAGGAIQSRVRQREADRDAFVEDSIEARRRAGLQAESAYLNLLSTQRRIAALEQALRSIISTEESTRRGVEVGLRTTLDLLNTQRDRFETERELAESRYAYLLEYLQLQVVVGGGLDASSIDDVNFFLGGTEPTQ
jgi:outer membrane protein